MTFVISDLRQRPGFFDLVADRIWDAWWKRHGVTRGYIAARLRETLAAQTIPFALVAHNGEAFLGTASVIASDLDERPQYTPWVAAVWIEPEFRARRIGAALVEAASQKAFQLGWERLFLCAVPARRSYYERLGWQPIEKNVGDLHLTVFRKERGEPPDGAELKDR